MDKESGRNNSNNELEAKIARSRDRLARDLRGVRYELDIPRKIRRSFRQQTVVWIGAAAVVGTLIVLIPLRKKKVYVDLASGATIARPKKNKLMEAGFLLGAIRIAATLLQPAIEKAIAKRMSAYVSGQQSSKW